MNVEQYQKLMPQMANIHQIMLYGHMNVSIRFNTLIDLIKPDVLVIEETSKGSKNAMSQKILEWTHFLLAQKIKTSNIKAVYIMTEEWRREIGCKMSDEEKLRNKQVRDYKKSYHKRNGKKTTVAYDINGKRIGLIGRKHVNIVE